MANGITTAFWSITVNNYDERDLAIFQNGYPDYCREIVYTLEKGEKTGTPHIQAWVKLQRQQRMSFLRKLFPGGQFKPCTSDEYIHNTKLYGQKKDGTTMSASVHKFNDPLHTLESVVKKIGERIHQTYDNYQSKGIDDINLLGLRRDVEKDIVAQDYRYAKVLVSATYKAMWKEFGTEILMNIQRTHTHTHTADLFSHEDEYNNDARSNDGERQDTSAGEEEYSQGGSSQGDRSEASSCFTDEGYTEGSGNSVGETDDCSE